MHGSESLQGASRRSSATLQLPFRRGFEASGRKTFTLHLAFKFSFALSILAAGVTGCSDIEDAWVRPDPAKPLSLEDLFPRDRLLLVDITIPDENWDTLRHQSRTIWQALNRKRQYKPLDSPYSYVEADITIDGVSFPRVGIRKKGFIGSQSTSRPSLKVKLNYTDKAKEIDGLRTLTFNNNLQDNTLMSQFMGYHLFNTAGSPAPRCALAKVTVNGKNLGVYAHVESAKKPLVQRAFGNDDGTLYEGTVVDFYEDWEGSFERKFGDDETGRAHIVKLIEVLAGGEGDSFFGSGAVGRAWVPTSGEHDDDWFQPAFDDSSWLSGENGAGYERQEGYEGLISDAFDFEDQMYGKATSLYLRFPFEIEDLSAVGAAKSLRLRMRCDDGFVAYINGHEVARSNAPDSLSWNSSAPSTSDDSALMKFSPYDITRHKDKLKVGRNVLAIHGMNNSKGSSDLLVFAELQTSDFVMKQEIWSLVDEEAFYTFWAIEGLLSFWDGYSGNRNNFFVYLNPDTQKFHFLPWGADAMFEKYSPLGVPRRSPRSVRTVGLVAHRLYQIREVRAKYAATMRRLLDELWDEEKLLAETHRIEAMVEPHLSGKQRGWWFNRKIDYEKIRRFIRKRRADIEREISGEDMPIWNLEPGPVIL